jgi:hypothetical protein
VLDHATSEIASGSKLGIDATKKIPGEGFKRPWPPLIKMDAAVKAKVEKLFNPSRRSRPITSCHLSSHDLTSDPLQSLLLLQ